MHPFLSLFVSSAFKRFVKRTLSIGIMYTQEGGVNIRQYLLLRIACHYTVYFSLFTSGFSCPVSAREYTTFRDLFHGVVKHDGKCFLVYFVHFI